MPPVSLTQLLLAFIPNFALLALITLALVLALQRLLDQLTLLWVTFRMHQRAKHRYLNTQITDRRLDNSHLSALLQADQLATQLDLSPQSFLLQLNLEQTLDQAYHTCLNRCENAIDELMNQYCPEKWLTLPSWMQQRVYRHVKHYLRPFLDDVIEESLKEAKTLFDFSQTINTQVNHHPPPYSTTIHQCLSIQTHRLGRKLRHNALLCALALCAVTAAAMTQLALQPHIMLIVAGLLAGASLSLGSLMNQWQEQHHPDERPPHRAIAALRNLLSHQLLDTASQVFAFQHNPKKQQLQGIMAHYIQHWFVNTITAAGPLSWITHWLTDEQERRLLCHAATEQCLRAMDVPFMDRLYSQMQTIEVDHHLEQKLACVSQQGLRRLLGPVFNDYNFAWYTLMMLWASTLTSLALVTQL